MPRVSGVPTRSAARDAARLAALIAALLTGTPVHADAPVDTIDVGERTPLAFVLVTPTGEPARTRSSDLIRLVDEATRTQTSLALRGADDAIAQGCRGRLLCLVLRLRPDYERDSLRDAGGVRPYSEHLRALDERDVVYPKLLLLLTNVTREGEPDRLSAQLIDTDRVLEAYHADPRDAEYWEANLEAAINENAPSSPRTEVATLAAAQAFVTALFDTHLRPSLEAGGQWKPFGHIELAATAPGLTILLDDAPVGVTGAGRTRLDGVLPGQRSLRVEGPTLHSDVETFEVVRGEAVAVAPELSARPTGESATTRWALEIVGAAAVVAGGVLVAVAAATPDTTLHTYCVEGALAGCTSTRGFVTSDYDVERGAFPNGGGVALAPLGLGLLAGGIAWGAGTLLFVEEDETPWIPLVVGVVLGVTTFAVSAAVGSGSLDAP